MGLISLLKRSKSKAAITEPLMRELPAPVSPAESPAAAPEIVAQPPSPTEVREQLFAAIVAGDEARLSTLCEAHREIIREHATAWSAAPEGLRANPAAVEWYERGLQLLMRGCLG